MTRISDTRLEELISLAGSFPPQHYLLLAETAEALRELRAYRKEGWVLVPKVPNGAMLKAAKHCRKGLWIASVSDARNLLAKLDSEGL